MNASAGVVRVLLTALVCGSSAYADDGVPIPGDDFVVAGAVKIKPGVYRIADKNGDGVIHVRGDGTKLDLTGVTLVGADDATLPDAYAGVGVSADGAKDVSITGGAVRGFKIGVRVHDCPAAKLVGIDASGNFRQHLRSTVEREDESDWLFGHENDDGHWERDYGAGIALKGCVGARVEGCEVRNGQNGLLLDRCDKTQVFGNRFTFNSGWGLALWRTCDTQVVANSLDWCVRGYSHGRYARGQDSAGILIFEQCSGNLFQGNSATHGGDGFFLYAGNETLKRTGEGGCDKNSVVDNDFSHAVANGIEATFSRGNTFRENTLKDCEHAIWAGYSWETTASKNWISHCANGISIEHGHDNKILLNTVEDCGVGMHLWWDADVELASTVFGKKHDLRSHGAVVDSNSFLRNGTDVRLENDQDSVLNRNWFESTARIERTGDTSGVRIEGESKQRPVVHSEICQPIAVRLPDFVRRGHRYILIDDWGPIPRKETRLFPAEIHATGAAKLSALGVDKKFEVVSLTDGFVAEPTSGDLPATITIRSMGKASPGAFPFEITVRCGDDVRKARGTVASMPWDVRFFNWTKDPRDDADAWRTLLAGPPVETRRTDGLDFSWKGGAVSTAVGADRFGTLATCEVLCATGTWRLATVSDDGIRVWLDGKLVVDDWTHHGPTPHDVDLDLAEGRHALRVEHFEIDGWAALSVSLTPAR